MPKYLDSAGVSYLWSKIKRITQNKLNYYSNTVEGWNSERFLLSEKNVLYIYEDYKKTIVDDEQVIIPGLKIGDGQSYLIDLPFLNNDYLQKQLMDHINDNIIHVSMQDRQFWDNKINLNMQQHDGNLIFNRQ